MCRLMWNNYEDVGACGQGRAYVSGLLGRAGRSSLYMLHGRYEGRHIVGGVRGITRSSEKFSREAEIGPIN